MSRYFFRLNGNDSAISSSRLRSSSVIGLLAFRASRITHERASTPSPSPIDRPISSLAAVSAPMVFPCVSGASRDVISSGGRP